ncbi:MAG: peptidylprolyl isomerase [Alphaproteobacteria bacterium]
MTFRRIASLLSVLALSLCLTGAVRAAGNPQVLLTTSEGPILVELFADRAPETVENFLSYVKAGHYHGTVFHRVIPNFMIQGGGFTADMRQKPTGKPIKNEADNGERNLTGTLAMARTRDPHSASAQFFINLKDNDFLDHTGHTPAQWGYAVFGRVLRGMEVVNAIAHVATHSMGPFDDVPVNPVTIQKVEIK